MEPHGIKLDPREGATSQSSQERALALQAERKVARGKLPCFIPLLSGRIEFTNAALEGLEAKEGGGFELALGT